MSTLSVQAQDLAEGLVGYWSFNGDLEDTAPDADPPANGVGKTWSGGGVADNPEALADFELTDPNYVDGKFEQCVKFADSFYVETPLEVEDRFDFGAIVIRGAEDEDDPDEEDPDLKGFTVSAWVTVDQFSKSWQCMAAKGEHDQWRMHRRSDGNTMTGNGGNGDTPEGVIELTPGDGLWYHCVLRSDRANDKHDFWVNGTMDATEDGITPEGNIMPMMIGQNPDTGDRTWEGNIDDVAMWNRPLTDDEILEIWADGDGSPISDHIDPPSDPDWNGSKSGSTGELLVDTTGEVEHAFEVKVGNKNGLTQDLVLSDYVLSGADADHFTLVETPTTLAPGAESVIQLSFKQKLEVGEFVATLTYQTSDPDDKEKEIVVNLKGIVPNTVGPLAVYRLDEAVGSTDALDSSGNGNDAAYDENDGSLTLGGAGLKEGLGTSMEVAGGGLIERFNGFPLNEYTISLWFQANSLGDATTGELLTLVGQGEGTPDTALLLASGELHWFGGEGTILFSSEGSGIEVGTVYHVAMIYKDGTGTILLDGSELVSGDVDPASSGGIFYAGAFGAGALGLDGSLDDIQFYDYDIRDLSEDIDEVGLLIADPGLVLSVLALDQPVDTDEDGLPDDIDPCPTETDCDGDGLGDAEEVNDHGTDPQNPDTDGDRHPDLFEVTSGYDPNDPAVPTLEQIQENLNVDLVAYYPFDGDLEDKAGDNHGEGMGSAPITYAAGKFGDAINLDGVDQYVETPTENEDTFDFGAPDNQTGFTVSAWFRVGTFDKNWQAIVAKGENNNWRIHRQGTNDNLAPVGGSGDIAGPTNVNDGELHHLALVSTPGVSVTFYVDGELEATGDPPMLENNEQPMMIGENPDALGRTFNGIIDDVAFWARPLSEGEVLTVANSAVSLGEILEGGGDPPLPGDRPGTLGEVMKADGGPFSFTISEGTFDVEYSTDLDTWTVIASDVSGTYEDTDAGRNAADSGYYRAVAK